MQRSGIRDVQYLRRWIPAQKRTGMTGVGRMGNASSIRRDPDYALLHPGNRDGCMFNGFTIWGTRIPLRCIQATAGACLTDLLSG